MDVLFFVLFLAALAYGLQRNHSRQTSPHVALAGSSDPPDRDLERVLHELRTP